MCRIAAALFLAVALATPARAQEVALALSLYGPFGVGDLGGTLPPSVEFCFTLPVSDRFSLEPFVTVGSYLDRRSAGPEGFCGAQIRQRIARLTREDVYLFASYGANRCFRNDRLGRAPLRHGRRTADAAIKSLNSPPRPGTQAGRTTKPRARCARGIEAQCSRSSPHRRPRRAARGDTPGSRAPCSAPLGRYRRSARHRAATRLASLTRECAWSR